MITELIKQRKFSEARYNIDFENFKTYFDEILESAFEEEDIVFYDFMVYLIEKGHNS